MKRSKINQKSDKRKLWLADYLKVLRCWLPRECARCNAPGLGWVNFGGTFEPHHPFQRTTHWRTTNAIPMCSECHRWIHDHSRQAREDRWIVEPKTIDHLNRDGI